MRNKLFLFNLLFIGFLLVVSNDATSREGMWLPQLLSSQKEPDMKALGMKMNADDIYSTSHSSLKDAVVHFGGGCTGEVVSGNGLVFTNHHCGFSQISSLSTVDKNYLKEGYWASTMEEELPCKGLTVTFEIEIRDVTSSFNEVLDYPISDTLREQKIKTITDSLEKEAVKGNNYKASVKSFYNGNQFFLFISEVFSDIRFVGAPPSSIGKFGGETDNWIWPRHSGDFSVFRIYASKENKPAEFSKENVPYHPKNFFKINLNGVKEGDFAMVFGYPGRTFEYIPSMGVDLVYSQTDPNKVKIREVRLKTWNEAMESSDTIKLQYASRQRSLTNYYKKWKGEIQGLKRNSVVAKKIEYEKLFSDWVKLDATRSKKYGKLLEDFNVCYSKGKPFSHANDYYTEALLNIELMGLARKFKPLADECEKKNPDEKAIQVLVEKLKKDMESEFRNFNPVIDEKVCADLLKLTCNHLPDSFLPDELIKIENKYKADFISFARDLYSASFIVSQEKVSDFLEKFQSKKIKKLNRDPAWQLLTSILKKQKESISPGYNSFTKQIASLQSLYMKAQLEMDQNKSHFPDANSTLRVSYGKVQGMNPRDAIQYDFISTLDGLMAKEDSVNPDFIIPSGLKEIFVRKDFGRYNLNGSVPVNFLASCHTTGGNSGSPLINSSGELIGINFDSTWEGVMGDYYYTEETCRNISVDIRYVLFIIEKFGRSQRLIDELQVSN